VIAAETVPEALDRLAAWRPPEPEVKGATPAER
jgi:hypothetical protein